jgi:predicted SprT family Zn-dependent metalloprotease
MTEHSLHDEVLQHILAHKHADEERERHRKRGEDFYWENTGEKGYLFTKDLK